MIEETALAHATAERVYDEIVRRLPLSQRLKLAAIILNDVPPQAVVDYSETWSEEDIRDFTAASWDRVLQRVDAEENSGDGG